MTEFVLHVDLDQFIAAVELLRHPELVGKPVVVGGEGDPTKRGVVSTASYEARAFGIRSGMPLRTAFTRCPEAVFLPVDAPAYLAASRRVMRTLRTFPATVEVAGWDEAFLRVDSDDPEGLAREIQRSVFARTRLWCSIGIGDNKLLAKVASRLAKPAGVFRLTAAEWHEVMDARPVDALWGIGRKTAARLAALGVRTVADLEGAPEELLARVFGPRTGPWLRRLAAGEDSSPVFAEPRVPKSRGRERTFQRDLTQADRVREEVCRLTDELAEELRRDGRAAVRLTVKVRFAPFVTSTHGLALASPTNRADDLLGAALRALGRFELDRPVRLVGVRAELAPGRMPEGVETTPEAIRERGVRP